MDKQKEIEEMQQEIFDSCAWRFSKHPEDYREVANDIGEDLYNLGYRNCKDKVVLTKEEYEKLKQYEEKVKSGACFTQKEWLELCDEECKRNTKNLSKARQLERKETAKELLTDIDNALHDLAIQYANTGHITYFAVCENVHHTVVSKVAKQHGVDIGEEV